MDIPPYLTHTNYAGVPDREIIEGYYRAMDRARKEGERRAMAKLKQAVTDAEVRPTMGSKSDE